MARWLLPATVLLALVTACDSQAAEGPVAVEVAYPNLTFERPLVFAAPPTDGRAVFVAEQRGMIYRFANRRDLPETEKQLVLDIRDIVRSHLDDNGHNEEGLLGLAFHPDFADNHKLYLDYSAHDSPRRSVIAEFEYNPDTGKVDRDSQRVLMEIDQPYGNHNGGGLAFGPEGYLYITKGDGGSAGDPKENGQDLSSLLGKILRIDVDDQENGKAYAIPDDNPFVDRPGARPEIYAWGLRNVWRFSFDPKTGQLWAGDVGQNKYEEIDIIKKGGNYGWDIREGFHPYEGDEQPKSKLIDPVHEYPRSDGLSVTGGRVYRGEAISALQGVYVFADYAKPNVWGLRYEDGEVTAHQKLPSVPRVASFGVDRAGELYACSFDGRIYKFVPAK
jgi:glucose/arabinose dehydrogenase